MRRLVLAVLLATAVTASVLVVTSADRRADPAVVPLASLSPIPYLTNFTDFDLIPDDVMDVAGSAESWGGRHPQAFAGVVRRPEAAYIGLTRDTADLLAEVRKEVAHPELLRAFRANHSLEEIDDLADEVRAFARKNFPDDHERLDYTELSEAMNCLVVGFDHGTEELVYGLKEEFGDRIFVLELYGPGPRAVPL